MGNSQAKKKKRQEQQIKRMQQQEKKISIAVIFLEGEDIKKIPQQQVRIFLRKKGLSDQNVQEAYKRHKKKQQQKSKQANSVVTLSVGQLEDPKKQNK